MFGYNSGITILDALDTLWLMGLREEYQQVGPGGGIPAGGWQQGCGRTRAVSLSVKSVAEPAGDRHMSSGLAHRCRGLARPHRPRPAPRCAQGLRWVSTDFRLQAHDKASDTFTLAATFLGSLLGAYTLTRDKLLLDKAVVVADGWAPAGLDPAGPSAGMLSATVDSPGTRGLLALPARSCALPSVHLPADGFDFSLAARWALGCVHCRLLPACDCQPDGALPVF